MKRGFGSYFFNGSSITSVATFDSGFGGFLSAMSIYEHAKKLNVRYDIAIRITHYGDTKNAPYGNRSPADISRCCANGIIRALRDGAELVFIACNTASANYKLISKMVEAEVSDSSKRIIPIIECTLSALKHRIDVQLLSSNICQLALFATPATVKAKVYPKSLSEVFMAKISERHHELGSVCFIEQIGNVLMHHVDLLLPNRKVIRICQFAPLDWVWMIEHGSSNDAKGSCVHGDLERVVKCLDFEKPSFDIVGELCTHFPLLHCFLETFMCEMGLSDKGTLFLKQGPLIGSLFEKLITTNVMLTPRKTVLNVEEKLLMDTFSRPKIVISGSNKLETTELVRTCFPNDPLPIIEERQF